MDFGRFGILWVVLGSLWTALGRFGFVVDRFGSFWVVPRFSNYGCVAYAQCNKCDGIKIMLSLVNSWVFLLITVKLPNQS